METSKSKFCVYRDFNEITYFKIIFAFESFVCELEILRALPFIVIYQSKPGSIWSRPGDMS